MKTLQQLFFERALTEKGIGICNVHINHGTPLNFNDSKQYNFVFPKSFLECVEKLLPTQKSLDYLFIGTVKGEHREFLKHWNNSNSFISTNCIEFEHPRNDTSHSNYKENFFNEKYFKQMCKAKFVLAPGGCTPKFNKKREAYDFLWSYRFWEAVLCKCIPITDEPDPLWHTEYKFYSTKDTHTYRDDWVQHNLNILTQKHFL